MKCSQLLLSLGLILVSSLTTAGSFSSSEPLSIPQRPIVTLRVTSQFNNVYDAAISAVLGRGLNIAHVDDAAKSLVQTNNPTFAHAKIIAFCSTTLSKNLILENPNYIVLCPFTLSIYQTHAQPNSVTLSYRNPLLIKPQSKALQQVNQLYQTVIEDATVWFSKEE